MSSSILSLLRPAGILTAMAALVAMSLSTVVSAASPVNANTGYDIPLSELNEVKKKTPSKRVAKESRKKKKSDAEPRESSSQTTVPVEATSQIKQQPVESNKVIQDEAVNPKPLMAVVPQPEPESTRIHHSPYSYIVADKRTVIHAVIGSDVEIREVNCTFRTVEGEAGTPVKMVKADGTQFTYTAVLPGLSTKTYSLRYTIDVVDSQGKVTHSQEFVTPVKTSPFVPGWQLEAVEKTIPVESGK